MKYKDWAFRLALTWIALMAILLYKAGTVEAFDVLELREVTVIYRSYTAGSVDPLLTQNSYEPGRIVDKGLDLEVNSDVLGFFYWDNTVHSMTDRSAVDGPGQFRMVGLEWRLGLDVERLCGALPLSIGWWHYSRHLLDTRWGLGHFPTADALEIKLKLFQR